MKKKKKERNFLVGNVLDSMDEKIPKGTILRAMATFTAMELAGSFISGQTGRRTTEANFKKFCESPYVHKKYHRFSNLLYRLFRNGVAHSYITKGGALLTSAQEDRRKHLKCYENGLLVYVPTLIRDIQAAIKKLYSDIKSKKYLRDNYNSVIDSINKEDKHIYDEFVGENKMPMIKKTLERDIITKLL
jgi:hypothetical protein